MLRVVIADDENIVRLGMQTIIDWEAAGFTLAGLFQNGKEALDYCLSNPVDLLITDIKMPVMDGIELIGNVRKVNPAISILVLSSYDEFDLVSNSFKKGAQDYILKQFITPQNLLDILRTIREGKSSQAAVPAASEKAADSRERKAEYLYSLLYSKEQDAASDPVRQTAVPPELAFKPENLLLVMIHPGGRYQSGTTECDGFGSLLSNVTTVVSETASKYCRSECIAPDRASIILLADFDISDEHDVAARLDDLLLDLQRTLGSIFNFNAVIGCSDLHRRLEELRGARLEAEEALEGRFFNPSRSISHYDGAKWPALSADYGKRIKKLVFNALKSKDYDPLRQILDRLFEDARSGSVASPMNFKQLVVEIVNEIDSYLIDSNNRNIRELLNNQPKPTAQTIIDFKHIDTLQAYILEIVGKLPAAARNINVVPVVERTKRYIHENYMNSISLSDISRQFEVSDGYLCRLFKEKTGENLFYYISRIRIEKSIELMETTDLSTNEIAEKVGYENANYFIKVFKKITQKTVSEFKHGR